MKLQNRQKCGNSMYRLDTCVWEITRKCNFNCAYCGSKAGTERQNELSTDQCTNVAKQLVDMNCRRVVIIGGEAFLKKDWDNIVKYLVDNGRDTSIITNGFLINDFIIEKLKETGIRHISLSIDGDRDVHDEFRTKGSFDKAIEAIKLLRENGFVTTVISTLNSKSINTIPELYKKLKVLHIDAWQLQCCSPFGNASDKQYLVPSKEQLHTVCEFVARENKIADFQIAIADNIGYHTELEHLIRGNVRMGYSGCNAGITTIGIDSVGNVRGCESLYDDKFIEGNLLQTTLLDIWTSPTAFAYNRKFRRDMLKGKCANCDVWYKCAGGCRSFNYFYSGEMYGSCICLK